MATLVQTDSRQQPPNHTLEDVAEEMLNGILCHYEPPPDRSNEMMEEDGGGRGGGMATMNSTPTTMHPHHHPSDGGIARGMVTQRNQHPHPPPHHQQQRRGILRAPKAWTRRSNNSKNNNKSAAKHYHPFQLGSRSSGSSSNKSVRWSDNAEGDGEQVDDDDDDINLSPRQRKKKENKKKKENELKSNKFPVEIGCNLSGTCTEVGIEAGCLSPHVETFVYNDEDDDGINDDKKARNDNMESAATSKEKKKHDGASKRDKSKTSRSSTSNRNQDIANRGISIISDVEDDDGVDEANSPPPPPPPPRRMPQKSTPAPKRSKSSQSSRRRYEQYDEEADWDDDDDNNNPSAKSSKTTSEKVPSKSSPAVVVTKKQYRRPHKEYETTSYDDDLNNSILDEDATDYMGSNSRKKKSKKTGEGDSGGRSKKTANVVSSTVDRDETGSAVSNTSSIFQRIWKRGATINDNGSIRSLVDSEEALNQRFGRFRGAGNGAARSRSASPYSTRRTSNDGRDAVEQMRDLSPMNQASNVPARNGVVRSAGPSPQRTLQLNDSDWDETIPIVRSGRPDARFLGGRSNQSRSSRSASPHGRGRSASLDRMQVRGPSASKPGPSQSPYQQTYRQPRQAPNPAWSYAPPPPLPTQAASYYHPAHPLVNRQPVSKEMEQQSLITAHRRGFDIESQTGSVRMGMAPPPPPPPATNQSGEFDRQSFIMSHRQGFDSGSDVLERQSYIMAHRQGFDERPAASLRNMNPVVAQRAPPPPPPSEAFMGNTPVPQQLASMQYTQPQQYPRPASQQPQGRVGGPVRGRSVSPARAANVPRGRSPSPSYNLARQRAQSPSVPLRSTSARRHSLEPQLQVYSYAPPKSIPTQLAPQAPVQAPHQPVQPSVRRESAAIEAYPPTRPEMEYQHSYHIIQQPQVPHQPAPNSMVHFAPAPQMYQTFPPASQQPTGVALKPVSSRQATPGKPARKGFLLGLRKPVGAPAPVVSRTASAQPTMQYYSMPKATPPAGAPVFLPEVIPTGSSAQPQQQNPSIPQTLPKPKSVAAESAAEQTIASDPLSVHDPYSPPAASRYHGSGTGTGAATQDPVTAYGTNWQPANNAGCNVMGAVWDGNKPRNNSSNTIDGTKHLAATQHQLGGTTPSGVESEQAQGEATSESKSSPDVELSWEERTRQAWERIRSGLIVFGEPQETTSEALSPCCSEGGTTQKSKEAEASGETGEARPEPVLLPDVPPQMARVPVSSGVPLPADRSVVNPNPASLELQQLYMTGPYDASKKHGILKQPSYDRRVTFGEPTEQFYDDARDEAESCSTDLAAKRRRVFRGRKMLSAFFGRGLSKANKLQDSGLPHLNTRSTEASSVTGVGSVSQEWDGGGYQNYYKSHLIDGSVCDPREPAAGAHNLTCHAGLSYQ